MRGKESLAGPEELRDRPLFDMNDARSDDKPIWVRWKVNPDGSVDVVATYSGASGFVRSESRFDNLDVAAQRFGSGFRDVVSRCLEEKSTGGRWRP